MVSMASRRRMIGRGGALDQRLLLGDVDRDADQVHARIAGLLHQLAAGAQPDPFAAGVQHAELVVDRPGLGVGELRRDLVEPDVVGMHQAAHFAERHQVVARRDAQDREHRMRPEDAAAGEVPVPQPAAAAVERGVDAASHGVVDRVGLARARGLPVKRKAQDQQHEAGGRGQRDGQRGVGAPRRERIAAQLERGQLAGAGEVAHRREGAPAVGHLDFQHAGAGAEDGERLRVAQHVGQARADRPAGGHRRGDDALGIAEHEAAAGRGGPRRQRAFQQVAPRRVAVLGAGQAVEPLGDEVGDVVEIVHRLGDRLAVVVEHLHHGADADGEQKGDDQGRDSAAQRRLGDQQPAVGRVGDRLRQAFD